MSPAAPTHRGTPVRALPRHQVLLPTVAGLFLAICLLKLGNPVILASKLDPPQTWWEVALWAWPISWGYVALAFLVLTAAWFLRSEAVKDNRSNQEAGSVRSNSDKKVRRWFVWLPLIWLAWQLLSATQTIRGSLTLPTLQHFIACVICFYLGYRALGRVKNLSPMWIGALIGFAGMISNGFDQHFGGLEATRRYIYSLPDWQSQPPEFLKKISSNRIYGTMIYPNTLAGAILLFSPVLATVSLYFVSKRPFQWLFVGLICLGSLSCLYWSGSKSGWLIAMSLVFCAWFHAKIQFRLRLAVFCVAILLSSALFYRVHSSYFDKGATSVSARFDYWAAALTITRDHPVLGSGPGTFGVLYRKLKRPESEMARLTHNDYLEQACDSGLPAGLLYSVFLIGSLVILYQRPDTNEGKIRFAVWLGLTGWAAQSFVEFGLYVPAISWSGFLFLGWLWGARQAASQGCSA